MLLLTLRELQSVSSQPGFRYRFSTGADLRSKLPNNCAVCFGWLLSAIGACFQGAATAAMDTTSFWPHMGCVAGSGLWIPVYWGCGERLGPGEENHSQGLGGRWTSNLDPVAHNPGPSAPHTLLQVSFFLFIVFTVYAMLPLGMRDAAAAGVISSLSHLLVLGLYLGWQPESQRALLPQVKMQVFPELAQLLDNAVSIC